MVVGCPKAPPALHLADNPAEALVRAYAEAAPGPVYAQFSAVVVTPNSRFTAAGTLVVSAPNRFRIELRGPIGPPQLVITCDGTAVHAYLAPKNTYFASDDASAALSAILGVGSGDGAAVVTSLLLGRVPALPPVSRVEGAMLVWTRDDGARLSMSVDQDTAHLVSATALTADGTVQFRGDWTPAAFPTALHAELPGLGASADLSFEQWNVAAPLDAAFSLAAPDGAKIVPLSIYQPEKLIIGSAPLPIPLGPAPDNIPGGP